MKLGAFVFFFVICGGKDKLFLIVILHAAGHFAHNLRKDKVNAAGYAPAASEVVFENNF